MRCSSNGARNAASQRDISMRIRRQPRSISHLVAAAAGLFLLAATGIPEPSFALDDGSDTATPIQHIVVLFQENVSFDHYFATYPVALNSPGEPFFRAREDTPSVNGLGTLV